MGFKFFRRKKEESGLPPLKDLDSYMPEFPDLKEELPPLPRGIDLEFPPLPKEPSLELPPLPPFPKGFKPKSVEEIKRAVGEVESKRRLPTPVSEPKQFNFPEKIQRTFEAPKPVERFIPKPELIQRAPPQSAPRPIPLEFAKRGASVTKVKKMFMEVKDYKIFLNALGSIKVNIVEAGNSLTRVEDINKSMQEKLEKWQSCLDTVQKKIIEIDKSLFK